MTGRSLFIAAALGVMAALLTWWSSGNRDRDPPLAAAPVQPAGVETTQPADADLGGAAKQADSLESGPRSPQVPEPDTLGDRVRRFLAGADALDEAARQARVAALQAEGLRRERGGGLLPGESAYLQLALLRVAITDPEELERQSQALLEAYQARSEAGWQAYREAPDPRHEAYRRAEAELVRQARAGGPDALSEDELRVRLRELRAQYYGDAP